ncbi:uncharacterized protein LOC106672942 isoform X2 [Cimex lectularius]|uniref:Protein phosphatase 1 regulatory subunit 35 C-terminal domain-containing protein n=1 Tax=Cimex lectularius TaxID=79782 RepID=A0A8I6SAT6_CIMLE|nr:uncharacterized protein LOC106672942 isoform X2 [Cimex lectularius]
MPRNTENDNGHSKLHSGVTKPNSTTSKQFVRNGEVRPPPVTLYESHAVADEKGDSEAPTIIPEKPSPDLAEPKLFSSLRLAKSVESGVSKTSKQSCRTIKVNSKPQTSQTKGLKTINIPFDEQIYRGLVDLQVSEEDIGICPNVPLKVKEFVKNKEEEPVLSDYYKPVFNKEYIIKPNPPVFDIQKQLHFTGRSVLNATKHWADINSDFKI